MSYAGNFVKKISRLGGIYRATKTVSSLIPKAETAYKNPPLNDTDKMEGMAKYEELEQYNYKKGAFYLGEIHQEHGYNFKAGISDDRHIFIVAGNAALSLFKMPYDGKAALLH